MWKSCRVTKSLEISRYPEFLCIHIAKKSTNLTQYVRYTCTCIITLYTLYLSTALSTVQVQVHFIYIIQNKMKLIIINLANDFKSRQQIL